MAVISRRKMGSPREASRRDAPWPKDGVESHNWISGFVQFKFQEQPFRKEYKAI